MKHATFTLRRARAWWRTGLLLALLGGCGGGVDSGGTGGATVTYANGPINGYGSIIVSGVRFDDNSPTLSVSDEDGPRGKDALKLGMVVEVRGSAIVTDASGAQSSTATSISFSSELVGPIRSIDLTSQTLNVLGQTVEVKLATVFDETLSGGLTALAVNDIAEVYALYNAADNLYVATRIERKSTAPAQFRIRGKVSGLTANKTFMFGTELIDFSALAPNEVPTTLVNGAIVRVRVNPLQSGGAWTATRLRDGLDLPDNGAHAQVEGLIENFSANGSIAQFSIGGVSIATNANTIVTPSGATLAAGLRVEVEGSFANGVLIAERVELEDELDPPKFDLRGPIEDFSPTDLTIRVRGQVVSYASTPEYVPPGNSASNLALGVSVEVKATLVGGNRLQATRIEFK
jgi:Domain of unknown function (DUF5666)